MVITTFKIPKDESRKCIIRELLSRHFNEKIFFGNESYIYKDGNPVYINENDECQITLIAQSFPEKSFIIGDNPLYEAVKDSNLRYHDLLKTWYIIEMLPKSRQVLFEKIREKTKHFSSFQETNEEVIAAIESMGFEVSKSEISPGSIIVKKKENIVFEDCRDFPLYKWNITSKNTDEEISKKLFSAYYVYQKILENRLDLPFLSKIFYRKNSVYFPHISDEISQQILDLWITTHSVKINNFREYLNKFQNTKCILFNNYISYLHSENPSDNFKFLGLNDTDPITLESFSELEDSKLMEIFLSDNKHNYLIENLLEYFKDKQEIIMPYDRDVCPYYKEFYELSKLGVLPYHNKVGIFNKRYFRLERIPLFKVNTRYYYKDSTLIEIMEKDFIFDSTTGSYRDYKNNIYKNDGYTYTVFVNDQKLIEYIGDKYYKEKITKAIQNGMGNLTSCKYRYFKIFDQVSNLNLVEKYAKI